MSVSEPPERKEVRASLRRFLKQVKKFDVHTFDTKNHNIRIQPIDLDEDSSSRPIFFTSCPVSQLVLDPDGEYDRERSKYAEFKPAHPGETQRISMYPMFTIDYWVYYASVCSLYNKDKALRRVWYEVNTDEEPFAGLNHADYEWGAMHVYQMKLDNTAYPHAKAIIYNNQNGVEGELLQGEVILALKLMLAQLRQVRFMEYKIAPILLFSFMGPQHARLVEAYFDGGSLVMRPTKLYDLRKKDVAVLKNFTQWYFGHPIGKTRL